MNLDFISLFFFLFGILILLDTMLTHGRRFFHPHTYKTAFNPPTKFLSFEKAWKNE